MNDYNAPYAASNITKGYEVDEAFDPVELRNIEIDLLPDNEYKESDKAAYDFGLVQARNYARQDQIVTKGEGDEQRQEFWLSGAQKMEQQEDQPVGWGEAIESAFKIENTFVNAIENEEYDELFVQQGYNVDEDDRVTGYEDYRHIWGFSVSEAQTEAVLKNLEFEKKHRDVIERSSLGQSLFSTILAAGTDPMYLPLFFVPPARGASMASQALKWTAAGFTNETAVELVKLENQLLRTKDEAAFNVAMTAIFSGALGGAAAAFGGSEGVAKAAKIVTDYQESPASVVKPAKGEPLGSASAMKATDQTTLDDTALISAAGLEKFTGAPIARISTSPSLATREAGFNLVDSAFYHNGHLEGKIVGNEAGSIEARIKRHDGEYAQLKADTDELFLKYRGRANNLINKAALAIEDLPMINKQTQLMTAAQFNEEVSYAVIRQGSSEIPEVREAALKTMKYFDDKKMEAIETGLLPESFKDKNTGEYLHRMWSRDKVIKNEAGLQKVIADHFQDIQAMEKRRAYGYESEMARIKAEEAEYLRSKGIESPEEIDAYLAKQKPSEEIKPAELEANKKKIDKEIARIKAIPDDEIKADIEGMEKPDFKKMLPEKIKGFYYRKNNQWNMVSTKKVADLAWKDFETPDIAKNQLKVGAIEEKAWKANFKKAWEGAREGDLTANKGDPQAAYAWSKRFRRIDNKFTGEWNKAVDDWNKASSEGVEKARAKMIADAEQGRIKTPALKGTPMIDTKIKQRLKAIEKDIETLQQKFDKVNVFASLSRADLEAAAMDAVNNIKGTPLGQLPYNKLPDDSVFTTGALKQRALDIPHHKVAGWLENDINAITRSYNRTVAPQIEIARDYGDLGMSKALNDVKADYDFMRADVREEMLEAGASKEAIGKKLLSLQKRQESDLRDLIAMRDKLLGVYGQPADPNDVWFRVGHFAKQLNFLRLLGQMTISALPDLARPIMTQGFKPVMRNLKILANPEMHKMALKDVRLSGAAWEAVLNSRNYKIAHLSEDIMYSTKLERGMGALSDVYGKVTLMTPWNDALKGFSGIVVQDSMLRAMASKMTGSASKREVRELAKAGISEDMAERIMAQFKKHGDDSGDSWIPNMADWDDSLAATAMKSAITKQVDEIIVTPSIGEMPLWVSSPIGSHIMQFKSFALSAHTKVLVSGLQAHDQAYATGLLLAVTMGAISYGSKEAIKGNNPFEDDAEKWLLESIDRSGAIGWLNEANSLTAKFSGGAIDYKNIWGGGGELSRYQTRTIAGSLIRHSNGARQNWSIYRDRRMDGRRLQFNKALGSHAKLAVLELAVKSNI